MNQTPKQPPSPAQQRPDLTIIPQAGVFLVAPHITNHEASQLLDDWANATHDYRTPLEHGWVVHIAHKINGADNQYTPTRTMVIPRTNRASSSAAA